MALSPLRISAAAETGLGLFEMKPNQVREDMEQWLPLIGWLAQRKPLYIAPGTPAITSAASVNSLPAAAPLPGAIANPGNTGVNPLATSAVSPPAATPAASETDPAPVPPAAPTIG
jgi:hypothetical protein